jgi:hypothetical protein
MGSIIYIAAICALCFGITHYTPALKYRQPDLFQAIALFCFDMTFALAGWFFPEFMSTNLGWHVGPEWLARIAQVIGALGGFYMAVRGAILWVGLLLAGFIVFTVMAVISYILGG